jgi:molybdopterin-biosynthesis enzyme MoeA-like protein
MGSKTHFGIVVVGDEILTGKRQDKHFPRMVELLGARGLELAWTRHVGDDQDLLVKTFRETFASGDVVFSFGGIGGTPDDRTRQAAAIASGHPLHVHPQGMVELKSRFPDTELTPMRLRMIEFPDGAEIIPNPVNRVPGFSLGMHHFVPGFPNMAWPMVEWVLDTRYAGLCAPGSIDEQVIRLENCYESQITVLMEDFTNRYPLLRMSCLAHAEHGHYRLELGFRGEPRLVATAMQELQGKVTEMGFQWRPIRIA